MEIYKDLSNAASQEFEKLLNSQLSKINIEEERLLREKSIRLLKNLYFYL